jgi:hypothetical protein
MVDKVEVEKDKFLRKLRSERREEITRFNIYLTTTMCQAMVNSYL